MEQASAQRPVVVGVSDDQPALLSYALGMAQLLDARLRVVHANSFQIGTGDLYEGRDAGNILHEAAQLVLADARKHLSAHTVVDVEYALRDRASGIRDRD